MLRDAEPGDDGPWGEGPGDDAGGPTPRVEDADGGAAPIVVGVAERVREGVREAVRGARLTVAGSARSVLVSNCGARGDVGVDGGASGTCTAGRAGTSCPSIV